MRALQLFSVQQLCAVLHDAPQLLNYLYRCSQRNKDKLHHEVFTRPLPPISPDCLSVPCLLPRVMLPLVCTAARLCPEGVEATLFATLMSILNGGSFVGSALGAGLTAYLGVSSTDFSNLFLLVLLCNFSTLLPAPFLGLLPASLDEKGLPGAAGAADSEQGSSRQQHRVPAAGGQQEMQMGGQQGVQMHSMGEHAGNGVVKGGAGSGLEDEEGVPLKSGQRN
jgi:hypothetical protein